MFVLLQSILDSPILLVKSTLHIALNCYTSILGTIQHSLPYWSSFFLTLVDDFSHATWTFLLHHKFDALHVFSLFLKMINTQFNTLVKTLRSDNGGEFISSHFQSLLHSHGIINQRSYPHTQENKVVECKCRHLLEIARSLMFQASLSSPFRGHAILMASSIINRLPSSFLSWRTPFENLQNRFPDYSLLRVFDCLCYATNTRPHKDRCSKWVYQTKLNLAGTVDKFKARLVVKGYHQIEGVDYNDRFSPVAKLVTVRLLLTIATSKAWPIHQLDINNAFLHEYLNEEIYMLPADGYTKAVPGQVCKLRRSLYGLKQASREWNQEFCPKLVQFGFRQFAHDDGLFIKQTPQSFFALLVHVDDVLIPWPLEAKIVHVKRFLDSVFTIKDLGYAKYFLGLEIG